MSKIRNAMHALMGGILAGVLPLPKSLPEPEFDLSGCIPTPGYVRFSTPAQAFKRSGKQRRAGAVRQARSRSHNGKGLEQ